MIRGRSPTLRKKLLFGSLAVILFFALAEGAVRLTGFSFHPMSHPGAFGEHFEATDTDHYVRDPRRFWIPAPGKTLKAGWLGDGGARISSLSTRGPEPEQPKPPELVRVLCVGDSGTFGWGVNDDQTYPAHLQEYLAEWAKTHSDRRFEVVNGGVNGYTTHQALEHLRILDPILTPDIILISTGRNDMTHLQVTDADRPVLEPWELKSAALLAHLRLGQCILWLAQHNTVKRLDATGDDRSAHRVKRVTRDQFQEKIAGVIRDFHDRPVLFLNRGGHYPHVIAKMAKTPGFYPVSLDDVKQLGQIQLFLHGGHPDTDAYRLIAEDIFNTMNREGLLDSYRSR